MKAKEAIIVHVEFDNDFEFKESGWSVFVGKWAPDEARKLVSEALVAMALYYKKTRRREMAIFLDERDMESYAKDIGENRELLDVFMRQGGTTYGDWVIAVEIIGFQTDFFSREL